ncbi:hypothetical protein [Novosphingobium sp. B1]|jgi:hypothetical protein|uniref:hypothetical protein n=1 Tax=Novosphingobium sp. B1 TaxID=1938756 RepID=UPI0009D869EE|nr:hypothetical protein [Novosphingobium sp. B1]SMC35312.1 hypothetical protein SAMN06272759_101730 [Novosphingobium sp. B1]
MSVANLETASADRLAPVLHAALHRLGHLGREGAVALARLVEDDDADFDEAAAWIADVASGALRE